RLNHDALKFFKNRELLVRGVNLGISLFLARQESYLFKALSFSLDIPRILFNQFRESTHVRMEVWIFRVYHDYLASYSGCNEDVQHILPIILHQFVAFYSTFFHCLWQARLSSIRRNLVDSFHRFLMGRNVIFLVVMVDAHEVFVNVESMELISQYMEFVDG